MRACSKVHFSMCTMLCSWLIICVTTLILLQLNDQDSKLWFSNLLWDNADKIKYGVKRRWILSQISLYISSGEKNEAKHNTWSMVVYSKRKFQNFNAHCFLNEIAVIKNNHVHHKNPPIKKQAHAHLSLAPVQSWHSGFLVEGYCITSHTNVDKSIFFFSLKAGIKHFHCVCKMFFWLQSTLKSFQIFTFFDIASLKIG